MTSATASSQTVGNEQEIILALRWLAGTLAGDDPAAGWPELTTADTPAAPAAEPAQRLSSLLESFDAARRQACEAERVRLLVTAPGGVPAPPYGSWWLEGRLQGETTAAVAELYRQEGVEPGAGPADYLPAELELVQLLLRHQLAARITGQAELAERARQSERLFLERYLAPWVPRFCAAGREATADHFWLAVFDLLEALLSGELSRS